MSVGLCVIDVQEKLAPLMVDSERVLASMERMIRGAQILDLPIVATEQYPEGLGKTVLPLPKGTQVIAKTRFSAAQALDASIDHWIVIGIEAHVCVLQTVRELENCVVLRDCVSSRFDEDRESALNEMEDCLSTVETVLFELMEDAKHPKFKEINALVKER